MHEIPNTSASSYQLTCLIKSMSIMIIVTIASKTKHKYISKQAYTHTHIYIYIVLLPGDCKNVKLRVAIYL